MAGGGSDHRNRRAHWRAGTSSTAIAWSWSAGSTAAAVRQCARRGRAARRRPGSTGRHDRRLDAAGRDPRADPSSGRACGTRTPVPAAVAAPSPAAPTVRQQPAAPDTFVPAEPSDFEVESDDFGADLPSTLSGHASEPPTGSSSRTMSDDVAFPVIKDQPAVPAPARGASRRPRAASSGRMALGRGG